MSKKTKNRYGFRNLQALRRIGIALVLFVFLLASILYTRVGTSTRVEAATSDELNFQARLLASSGAIVPDGNYHVEFKLYDAASSSGSSQGSCAGDANCLWTETYTGGNVVEVKAGYLSVHLGSITSFPNTIPWDDDLWVAMNIGGSGGGASWDGEMTPRLKLTAVPYAFAAGSLSKADSGNAGVLRFDTVTNNPDVVIPDIAGTNNLLLQSGTTLFTQGSISFTDANGRLTQDNANFFFDNANNRLGVGSATPNTVLDISGAFSVRGLVTAPAVSPTSQGRIYYDSSLNDFYISVNNGAYQVLCNGGGNCSGSGSGVTQSGTNALGQIAYFTSSNNLTSNGLFFWDNSNTRLGIGTNTPSAGLDVRSTPSPAATGNTTNYGSIVNVTNTVVKTADIDNTYGLQVDVNRSGATGGTINNIGLDIDVDDDGGGTSTNIGLQVDVSGADTNYAALFTGGFVGVGNSDPTSELDLNGALTVRGISSTSVSPSGQARLYFDSDDNLFYASLNGGAYDELCFEALGNCAGSGSGVTTTGGTANRVAYFTGSQEVSSSDNLFFDGTDVGIGGVLTPTAKLDVLQSSSSTTAGTLSGQLLTVTDTGIVTTGTDTTYGQQIDLNRSGATGGTINNIGLDIDVDDDGGGTSTNIGLQVDVSGADTNYAALFTGGFVGVGNSDPTSELDLNGALTVRGISSTSVSPSGQARLYFDSDDNLFYASLNGGAYDELCFETLANCAGAGNSVTTPGGTAGQVAYFSNTQEISSSTNLLFNGTNFSFSGGGTFSVDSSGLDISTGGALSNVAGFSQTSGDFTYNNLTGAFTVNSTNFDVDSSGNLATNGNIDTEGTLSVGNANQFTVNATGAITAATGITSSGTITFSGLGAGLVQANGSGVLSSGAVDRNSATFFNTALSVGNGGTGATTLTTNGVLYGAGTGAVQATSAGTAGQVLLANGSGVPTFTSLSGDVTVGATGTTTIGADAVALGTDTTGNYVATVAGNAQITVTGSGSETAAVSLSITNDSIGDTQLAFNTGQHLTTTSDVNFNTATLAGDLVVNGGAGTFGADGQAGTLTLYDGGVGVAANTLTLDVESTLGQNSTISFPDPGAATAFVCYQNDASCGFALSAGAIDGSGNTNQIAYFTDNDTLASNATFTFDGSDLAYNNLTGAFTVNSTNFDVDSSGNLATNGNIDTEGTLSVGNANQFTVNATGAITAATGITSSGTITFSGLGAGLVQANGSGVLSSGAVDRNSATFFNTALSVGNGGTGATTLTTNGVLYGAGTGAVQATSAGTAGQVLLANGSGVPTFTSLSGDVTVGATGTTTIGADAVALGTDTTGNYVATVAGNAQITVTGSGSETAAVSLSITNDSIGDTQLAFNTGQHLTTTSDVNFNTATLAGDLVVNGGAGTFGADGQAGTLTLYDGGVGVAANTLTLDVESTLGQNSTISFPDPGAATAFVCYQNDASCGFALSAGAIDGSGNTNQIAYFTDNDTLASNATFTFDGSDLAYNNLTGAFTVNSTNFDVDSSGNLATNGNIDTEGTLSVGNANQFTVNATGAITAATGITSSGTITFSGLGAGLVQANGSGVLSSGAVDRNSATFFNTALSVGNGGTGATTLTTNGVLYGAGTGAVQATSAGTAGQVLLANGSGVPTFTSLSGDVTVGATGTTTIGADAVALGTDTTGNYVATVAGNAQITVTGSGSETAAVSLSITNDSIGDTQLAFNTGQHLTTTSDVNFNTATLAGDLVVNGGAGTFGADGQAGTLTLYDGGVGVAANTLTLDVESTLGQNSTISFPDPGAATAFVCYQNDASCGFALSAGAIDGSGNTNQIAYFTDNDTLASNATFTFDGSDLAYNNLTGAFTVNSTNFDVDSSGNLATNGNIDTEGTLSVGNANQFTVNATGAITAATGITSSGTITFSGLGAGLVQANGSGVLSSGAVDRNSATFFNTALSVGNGGTGATTLTTNGVLYGAGTGAVQATSAGTAGQVLLANGSGVPTFTSLSGDVTVGATGTTTIGADAVALGTDTTGNYVATVAGNAQITVTGSGSETAAVSLSITNDSIGDTQLAFNTGQHLTTTSDVNFNTATLAGDLVVNGGAGTFGADGQAGTLTLYDGGVGVAANTLTLDVESTLGQNSTISFPDPGAATAFVCYQNDASCGFALSAGAIDGSGNTNQIAYFTDNDTLASNATFTFDGSDLAYNNLTGAFTVNSTNFDVDSSGNLATNGNIDTEGTLSVGNANQFTVNATGAITAATGITSSGTITFSGLGAGLVQANGSGVLSSGAVDRNSATFFNTALSVGNGGTGATTLTTNGVLYGAGTGAVQATSAGTAGQVLLANGSGVPTFTSLSGDVTVGATGTTTIGADAVALGTDTTGNYVATVAGNAQITVTGSGSETAAVSLSITNDSIGDTQLAFNTGQHLTTTSDVNFNTATLAGDLVVNGGAGTFGADGQAGTLTLYDGGVGVAANTLTLDVESTLGQNSTISFPDPGAATAFVCYQNDASCGFALSAGAIDGSGNTNQIAYFTDNDTLASNATFTFDGSDLAYNNLTGAFTVNSTNFDVDSSGNLATNGNIDTEGTLSVGNANQFTVNATGAITAATGITSSGTITFSGLGAGLVQANGSGVLSSGAVDRNSATFFNTALSVGNGGTGATTLTTNGVLYGAGTGAVQATSAGTAGQVLLANGSGVPTFTSLSGDVTVGATGTTTIGADAVALGTDTTGNYVATVAGNAQITVTGSGSETAAVSLSITNDSIGDTQLAFNTGQHLTTTSDVNFNTATLAGDLVVNGGAGTFGADGQAGTLTLYDGGVGVAANTLTLDVESTLGQNTTVSFPDPGAATAFVCYQNDASCGFALSAGAIDGGGASNQIAYFSDADTLASNATFTFDGSDLAYNNLTGAFTVNSTNFDVDSSGNLATNGNIDTEGTLSVGNANQFTVNATGAITAATGITSSGTITFSGLGAGLVQANGSGVLSSGAVDRNSATFFSNTLNVANGGTGAATLTTNGVLYGAGTGAVQATSAGTAGQVLLANGSGVPTFTSLSGDVTVGATGTTTIGADAVALGTDTTGNYVATVAGNAQITVTGSGSETAAVSLSITNDSIGDTQLAFNTGQHLTTTSDVNFNTATLAGDLVVNGGAGTFGADGQAGTLTLYDGGVGVAANTLTLDVESTLGQNSTISFPDPGAATAFVCYQNDASCGFALSAGAIDGSGNTNQIAYFTDNDTLASNATFTFDGSDLAYNNLTGAFTVNSTNFDVDSSGNLATNGNIDTEGTLSVGNANQFTVNATGAITAATGITSSGTITFSGLGAGLVQANGSGVLSSGAVDRNSATFFNTALSVGNGGTGATTLTTNGVLYGAGTGAVQATSAGTAGQVLLANGSGVPTFTSLSGDVTVGATGTTTIGADAVALGTDTTGNYVATVAGNAQITVTGSGSETAAVSLSITNDSIGDTQLAFNTGQHLTTTSDVNFNTATLAGDLVVNGGAGTFGADGQAGTLTLYDGGVGVAANTLTLDVESTLGQNSTISFPDPGAATAFVCYQNDASCGFALSAGAIDGSGNTNQIAYFTDNDTLASNATFTFDGSDLAYNNLTGAFTVNSTNFDVDSSGNLATNGNIDTEGTLSVGNANQFTVNATGAITAATGITSSGTITFSGLGAGLVQANGSGVLSSGAVDRNSATFFNTALSVGNGGTGATTLTTNGVLYGAGTGAVQATSAGTAGQVLLANGSGVPTFTSLSGDVTVGATGTTTIGADAVALGTDTTGNYVATVAGNAQITVTGSGSETAAVSLSITNDSIGDTQLAFNTGQHLTTTSDVNFNTATLAGDLVVNGGAGTFGADGQAGTLTLYDGGVGVAANTLTLDVESTLGQNTTVSFPDPGAATAFVCYQNDASCGFALSAGAIDGGGASNQIAYFSDADTLASNATFTFDGSDLAYNNLTGAFTVNSTNFDVDSSGNLATNGNIDTEGTLSVGNANQFTVNATGAITAATGITSSGTITFSGLGAGLVQANGSGVLSSGAVDRNSATFFSNTLNVANGGTGAATLTTNGVLYGAGTGAVQATSAGTAGQVLLANGSGVPTFTSLSGDVTVGATGTTTIGADAVALGTDTTGNYVATVAGNAQITVTGSGSETAAVSLSITNDSIGDTQLAFNTGQHLTTTSDVNFNTATLAGDLVVNGGAGTFGADGQAGTLTLYDGGVGVAANTLTLDVESTLGQNTTVSFPDPGAATAFVCYQNDASCGFALSAGAIDGGGASNQIAYFSDADTLASNATFTFDGSDLAYNNLTGAFTVNSTNFDVDSSGNLATNGNIDTEGTLSVGNANQFTVNATGAITAATGITSSGTITFSGLGAGLVQANGSGVLSSGAVDRNSATFFNTALSVGNGGTGATTLTTNGVLYGAGTGAVQATSAGTAGQVLLANGSGVPTFTSLSGDVTVGATGTTTIGADAVALGTDTTGNYVATVAGNAQITVTGSGSETAAVSLSITNDSIGDTQLAFNTGQHLTTTSDVNFNTATLAGDLVVNGGAGTFGADGQAGTLTLYDGGVGVAANTLTLDVESTLGQNTTVSFPDPGAATAFVCYQNDASCGFALSAGAIDGGGASNQIAYFSDADTLASNATFTFDGSDLAYNNLTGAFTVNSTNFDVDSSGNLATNGNIDTEGTLSVGNANQFTVNATGAITAATGITSSGTITFSGLGAGLVQANGSGVLSSGAVDRNSATFFSNTLNVANGGTGAATLTTNGVLYGAGTGAVQATSAGTAGQVLLANGSGVPTFTSLSGDVTVGATGTTTIGADAVALGTDTTGNYVATVAGNAQITVTGSGSETAAVSLSITNDSIGDTQLAFNTGQHLTTTSDVNFNTATLAGDLVVNGGAGTFGADGQAGTLTLYDGGVGVAANTLTLDVESTLGQNSTISFPDPGAATAFVCYQNDASCGFALSAGAIDGSGNTNQIAYFTDNDTLASNATFTFDGSDLAYNNLTGAFTVNSTNFDVDSSGNLATNGNIDTEGTLSVGNANQFTVNATGAITAATGITSSGTITFSGLGAGLVQANGSGVLSSGAVDRNSATFFNTALSVGNGGTGATTLTTNGVLYGAGTGAVQATSAGTAGQVLLANGSGVPTFTSLSGDVTVGATGTTTIGADAVALGTDTTGNYVATVAGNAQITVTGSGSETAAVSLSITNDSIGDTQLAFNTGQHLTTTSDVNFNTATLAGDLVVNGGAGTFGADGQAGTLTLYDGGVGVAANTLTLDVESTLGQNSTISFPDPGAATAFVCYQNDASCGFALSAGAIDGSGNTNQIAYFTDNDTLASNATFTFDGSDLAYNNLTGAFTVNSTNFDVDSSGNLATNGNIDTEGTLSVGNANQFTVNATGAITAATGITSSGTITFSGLGAGLVQANGSGVLSSGAVDRNSATFFNTALSVGNGGTGATTLTGLLLGNGTSPISGVTTSAGVAGALSDETGTGLVVFNASPTFTGTIDAVNLDLSGDLVFAGDTIDDLTGSGLTVVSGDLTVDSTSATGFFRNGGNDFGGNAVLGTNGVGQTLTFKTAGANRATIDATGNLQFLQASTISTSTGALTLQPNAGSNVNITTSGTGDFAVNTNLLYADSSASRVGIGTSTPGYQLDLRNSGIASQLHFSSDTTDAGGYITSAGSTNFYFSGGSAWNGTNWIAKAGQAGVVGTQFGQVQIFTNDSLTAGASYSPTARLTVEAGGNVGIGDTGPDAKLEVLATTEQLRLTHTDTTADSRFTVDASGNLTINNTGTKTVIADDLQVTGNDILDSAAATRLTLGATTIVTATNVQLGSATTGLQVTDAGVISDIDGATVNINDNLDVVGSLFVGSSDQFQITNTGNFTTTGTGSIATTNASAFQVQNTGGSETVFNIDTNTRTGGTIKIGNSTGTDTATTLLRVDSATADITTGLAGNALDGSIYYNTTDQQFKVIRNSIVDEVCTLADANCTGGAGGIGGSGTANQIAYFDSNNTITSDALLTYDGADFSYTNATGQFSIDSDAFDVTDAGAVSGVTTLNASGLITSAGLNATSGLIQGTGGLTITGTTSINTTGSAATNIATGGTGSVSIGNSTGTFNLDSADININSGAITGATGIESSGNIDFASLNAGGLVKSDVTTGRLSIATAGTDYEVPLTFDNGLSRTVDNVQLGGSLLQDTTVSAGNAYSLNLISDLSGGARTSSILNVTQANDPTNNSNTAIASFINNDTGSTAPTVQITQSVNNLLVPALAITTGSSSIGISVNGVTNGNALSASSITSGFLATTGASLTSGSALRVNLANNTALTSGSAVRVDGAQSGALPAYTGSFIDIAPTRTITGATTINDTGRFLNLNRSVTNNGSGTVTLSGSLANLQSTCGGSGACTDTATILNLAQNNSTSSGTVLNLSGAGTGNLASLDTTNASANGVLIDVQSNSSSQYALSVTTNNGANSGLYVRADGNIGIGNNAPSALLSVGSTSQFQVNATGQVTYVNGTSDTTTQVCRNAAGQLAACFDDGSGTGLAFVQGGNSFGAQAVLGTNDNNSLAFETNTATRFVISNSASIFTGQGATTITSTGTTTLGSAAANDLTINSGTTGNINIGTDASDEAINIGTGTAEKNINIGNSEIGTDIVINSGTAAGNHFSVNSDDIYVDGSTGNVGIGTTATNEVLTVGGTISILETVTAPTQTANHGKIYVKSSDNLLYFIDDGGNEYNLTAGGSTATLQSVYNSGNSITTTDNRDIQFVLGDTTTDADFTVNMAGTGNQVNFQDGGTNVFTLQDGGNVTFQNSINSSTAFLIKNASGTNLFEVDSTNNRIHIGSSTADATGTLLVLDSKNTSGDPAGVNGALYYNSSLNRFRCHENGAWGDCGTLPSTGYFTDPTDDTLTDTDTDLWDQTTYANIELENTSHTVLISVVMYGTATANDDEYNVYSIHRAFGSNPTCASTQVGIFFVNYTTNSGAPLGATATFMDVPGAAGNARYTVCSSTNATTSGGSIDNVIDEITITLQKNGT